MAKIYIPSKELIKTLNITDQELIDTQKFFDSIPDDEWELNEGKDYRIVAANGLREYTESGAYTIARYLEGKKKGGFLGQLTEWLFHTREKIRKSFVKRKILENSSSLIKRNNILWLSTADVVAIFGTKSDYLKKMHAHATRTENSLLQGSDFDDFGEGVTYYSLAGVYKLSSAFKECLTKKNRKDECADVGQEIQPQIKDIVDHISKRNLQIEKVKQRAKTRDKKTCQVTLEKGNQINPIRLAAHHLYSQNEYPLLADSIDNIITISCDVHDQFHLHYMGGTQNPCTVDHFIEFVQQYYPGNSQVVIWLQSVKMKLGQQVPVGKKNPPHVLYVPYSRVS